MRILDEQGRELEYVDESKGYAKPETIVIQHHDEVEFKPAVYEDVFVEEYPNGGKLYEHRLVSDQVEHVDAYDDTEDIIRFVAYTQEELDAIAAKKAQEEKEAAEAAAKAEEERKQMEAAQEQQRKQWEAEQEKIKKEQAEKEAKEKERNAIVDAVPNRLDTLERSQLDTDEAVTSLYEAITSLQTSTEA